MKSPIDIVRGRIVDIDKHGIVTIKARYDDWPMLLKREYKECNIQMIDSRPLSDKQRRTCYKLIRLASLRRKPSTPRMIRPSHSAGSASSSARR